jgi:hypothetical protein
MLGIQTLMDLMIGHGVKYGLLVNHMMYVEGHSMYDK